MLVLADKHRFTSLLHSQATLQLVTPPPPASAGWEELFCCVAVLLCCCVALFLGFFWISLVLLFVLLMVRFLWGFPPLRAKLTHFAPLCNTFRNFPRVNAHSERERVFEFTGM